MKAIDQRCCPQLNLQSVFPPSLAPTPVPLRRGEWTLAWDWPDKNLVGQELTKRQAQLPGGGGDGGRRAALVSECPGQTGRQYCKRLTMTAAKAGDTGYYRCYYKDVRDVIVGTTAVSVYVFVRGESPGRKETTAL